MAALETVKDYITDARTLLQDTVAPYRYDDPSMLVAFNVTLLEVRRIRADLFIFGREGDEIPSYINVDTERVHMEPPFRLALVYGTCAHALGRDQEDVQDVRATVFWRTFYDMLLGVRVSGITPPQQQQAGG